MNRASFGSTESKNGIIPKIRFGRSRIFVLDPSFFLVFLLIAFSGNPFFPALLGERSSSILFVFFAFFSIWLFVPKKISLVAIIAILLFSFLSLIHISVYGFAVLPSAIGLVLILVTGSIAVKIIPEIWIYYIKAMTWLAGISLIFQIPQWLGINLASIAASLHLPSSSEHRVTLILHNYIITAPNRNSGMFWEPGAYAGYLALALLMTLLAKGRGLVIGRLQVLVIFIALLSTMSTTGYAALGVICLYWAFSKSYFDSKLIKIAILPVVVVILSMSLYLAYEKVGFLGEKVQNQWEKAVDQDYGWRLTRFGNLLYDVELIKKSPVYGWSMLHTTTGKGDAEELASGQGNGFSGFAVQFGLIGMCFYFWFLFKSFRSWSGSYVEASFAVATIVVLLNGEKFLNYYIFWALILGSGQLSLQISPWKHKE